MASEITRNLTARPRRNLAVVLPMVALATVLLVALWVNAGSLLVALGLRKAHVSRHDHPGADAPLVTPLPTHVRLASAAVAEMLGIELAAVEARSLTTTVSCNGRASFNENRYAHVRSRVDGIVERITVDVGAEVKQGTVLAMVDSPLLGDLKASYINAITRREQLQWEFDRLKKLSAQEAVAGKSFRETQSLYEQQQTTTANTRQQLVNLGFLSAQLDLMVETKDTGTELPIVAPWDGVIVARHAVDGELVERNAQLFAMANLDTMWVYLNLYESDIGKVKLGQPVSFDVDGLEDTHFAGHVDWISPEVDAQTRTTQVRSLVTNVDGALRANMFGKGKIVVQQSHKSLTLPEDAVQAVRDELVVFVQVSPQEYEVRPVEIGIRGDRYWEVLRGVEAGELVATTGSFLLKSDLEKDKLQGQD